MRLHACAIAGLTGLAVLSVAAFGRAPRSGPAVLAQEAAEPDLFDQTLVRDFQVRFTDADWQRQLDQAGEATNVRAPDESPLVHARFNGADHPTAVEVEEPFHVEAE